MFINHFQEDDPKQRKPDISYAKRKINWEPKTDLNEGLKHTINYFEKFYSFISSLDILSKIKKKPPNILVVGDIMLDRFIFGNVHRISPEAPVPIVRSVKEKYCLGGCGNVLRNLTNLGLHASVVSIVGNDQAGKKIIKDLSKKKSQQKP